MAKSLKDWRREQSNMIKRHEAEIEACSDGARAREIKELIQTYEPKLRASQGTEFVNLQVELNRKITELQSKANPSQEDLKKRHDQEKQVHLMRYSRISEASFRSFSGSQPSNQAPKEPPSNTRPAKRRLAEEGISATSLVLDGTTVRWLLRVRDPFVSKRQRLDNASCAIHKTMAPAPIQMLRYDQVRSNAINGGHWDTIVEWPNSSGQFWVIFCAQHNMHFKQHALVAGAKHIYSPSHGVPNKDWSTALIEIGYYIPDCDAGRAGFHNSQVQQKIENGYEPCKRFKANKTKAKRRTMSDVASPQLPLPPPSRRMKLRIINNPKPYHVYYCYFEKQYWACLILGWDKQIDACYVKTLGETDLLHKRSKPPSCYIHTSHKIEGWAEGFEDGGPKVDLREFPIMYFDGAKQYGWAPAALLSKMDLTAAPKGEEYPEFSYHEARQWIATAAGYSTWDDYRASDVNIKKLTLAPMSKGQTPTLGPTNLPSDPSLSDFDEVLERLRVRGGDDTDDEDYQDEGRGFEGGRPLEYVVDYEDDEWTTRYNTRQEGILVAKSSDTPACKLAGKDHTSGPGHSSEPGTRPSLATRTCELASKDQKSGPGHKSEPVARPSTGSGPGPGQTQKHWPYSPTIAPANLPTNGVRATSSASRPSPGIGVPSSESVPSARLVASMTAWRTKSTSAGLETCSSKPKYRLADLRPLATDTPSQDGTREVNPQLLESSRGQEMKTTAPDDRPSTSPVIRTMDQRRMSAGPTNAEPKQRRASASSRATTTSGEAMPATSNLSLVPSPISTALTPMMAAASPAATTNAWPGKSGQPRVYEITKYADARRAWERSDREEACVKLCLSEDEKTVTTSDERISIAIDPQQCMKPQLQTIEGREGMSLMTLPQVSGEAISMVFDRSRGSKNGLGKIQARNFVRWLQAQNVKLR